jgi:hypothetical protein
MDHLFRLMAIAALAPALAGCGGGDGFPREPVSGKVTLDGSPLETGLITFAPEDLKLPPAGTVITDGSYSMGRSEGPCTGPNKVTISCRKPTGKKLKSVDFPGTFVDEMREVIPAQYNVDSRLGVEVKKAGENRFDFELSSGVGGTQKKAK